MHTHKITHRHTRTHTQTDTHTFTQSHTKKHAHTRSPSHTETHKNTRTQTHNCFQPVAQKLQCGYFPARILHKRPSQRQGRCRSGHSTATSAARDSSNSLLLWHGRGTCGQHWQLRGQESKYFVFSTQL